MVTVRSSWFKEMETFTLMNIEEGAVDLFLYATIGLSLYQAARIAKDTVDEASWQ